MVRLYVPPAPELASPKSEPDPLLEKFRQDTIKGKQADSKFKLRKAIDSPADYSDLDWFVLNAYDPNDR